MSVAILVSLNHMSNIFKNRYLNLLKKILPILTVLLSIGVVSATEIKVEHLDNPFAQIRTIYDSKDHGLFVTNPYAVYKINKENESAERIPYAGGIKLTTVSEFFEYKDELYCYAPGDSLYVLRDGVLKGIDSRVVDHLVQGDDLYLMRAVCPRVVIYHNDEIVTYNINTTEEINSITNIVEIGEKVFGYYKTSNRGDIYLFEVNSEYIDFLVSPTNENYAEIREKFLFKMYKVNDKILISSSDGFLELDGRKLINVNEKYGLSEYSVMVLFPDADKFYGLTPLGVIICDLNLKETKLIIPIDFKMHSTYMLHSCKKNLYFNSDIKLYTYNKVTAELTVDEKESNEYITEIIEDHSGNMIRARSNRLEYYVKNKLKQYSPSFPDVYLHTINDMVFNSDKNELLSVGCLKNNFVIQIIKEDEVAALRVPVKFVKYSMATIGDGLIGFDNSDNYYFAYDSCFGKFNGNNWERISFLENPQFSGQRQEYRILLADHEIGTLVCARLYEKETSDADAAYRTVIYRYKSGTKELVYSEKDNTHIIFSGQAIKINADKYIVDAHKDYMLLFNKAKIDTVPFKANNGTDKISTSRSLCMNSNNQLVVCYDKMFVGSFETGTEEIPQSISEYNFDTKQWDHQKYDLDILSSDENFFQLKLVSDSDKNEYLVNNKDIIAIGSAGASTRFSLKGQLPVQYSAMYCHQDKIWSASKFCGIFNFELPEISSVSESIQENKQSILKTNIIRNNTLELAAHAQEIILCDISGRIIEQLSNVNTVDLSSYVAGSYIVFAVSDGQQQIQQFILIK